MSLGLSRPSSAVPERKAPVIVGLLLILMLGFSLRIVYARVSGVDHDDACAWLQATGHALQYARVVNEKLEPLLVPVPMERWQEFLQLDRAPSLSAVVDGLRLTDVHPPLFFLLLHLWLRLWGSAAFSAKFLVMLIDVAVMAALFFSVRELLDARYALLATLFYAISPAFFDVAALRPYTLLNLCNLLAFYACLRLIRNWTDWRWWALWGLAVVAGFNTQYLFGIAFVPMGIFLLILSMRRGGLKGVARFGLALASIFTIMLPTAYLAWQQVTGQTEAFAKGAYMASFFALLPPVTESVLVVPGHSVLGVYFHPEHWRVFTVGAAAIYGVVLIVSAYGLSGLPNRQHASLAGAMLAATALIPAFLYAIQIGMPAHSVGTRYYATLIPYFLIAIVAFIARLSRVWLRTMAIAGLLLLMSCSSLAMIRSVAVDAHSRFLSPYSVAEVLPKTDLLILDSSRRGIVLPVAVVWPGTQRVMVGSQEQLLGQVDLPKIVSAVRSVTYVSSLSYGNSVEKQAKIASLISSQLGGGSSVLRSSPLELKTTQHDYQVFAFSRE